MKDSMNCNKESIIIINDIFDELKAENNRLLSELLFANKCISILAKIYPYFNHISDYIKCGFDLKEKQDFNELENEYKSVIQEINGKQCVDKNNEFNRNSIETKNNGLITRKSGEKVEEKGVIKGVIKVENKELYNQLNDKQNNCFQSNNSKEIREKSNKVLICHKNSINSAKIQSKSRKRSKYVSKKIMLRCDWIGCDFETNVKYKSKLITHMTKHTGERPLKCEFLGCNKAFRGQHDLRSHIRRVHEMKKTIACEVENCKKMFKEKSDLKAHMTFTHSDFRPFVCTYNDCSFRTRNKTGLETHLQTHSAERLFKCSFSGCEKRFRTEMTMKGHLLIHSAEPTIKCPFDGCDQMFKTHSNLYKHKLDKHRSEPLVFNCDWPGCEYTSKTSQHLKNHKSIHTGEKNYVCNWPECGKRFRLSKFLRDHLRIHNNDKRYNCHWPGCQYKCTNSANLCKHFKIHKKNTQLYE